MKKIKQYFPLLALLLAFILATPFALLVQETPEVQAASWYGDWVYRQKFEVARAGGAVTNYTLKMLIVAGSGTSTGATCYLENHGNWTGNLPNDLMFTASDSATELSYYIESSNSTHAEIWVEFNSIGTSATSFYAYYGNDTALSTSDDQGTFRFFDDFNDGHFPTHAGWSNHTASDSMIETGGQLRIDSGADTDEWWPGASYEVPSAWFNTTSFGDFSAVTKLDEWSHADPQGLGGMLASRDMSDGDYSIRWEGQYQYTRLVGAKIVAGAGSGGQGVVSSFSTEPVWLRIDRVSDTFYLRYSADGREYTEAVALTSTFSDNVFVALMAVNNDYRYFDYFWGRNYASPEPVFGTWYAEEDPVPDPPSNFQAVAGVQEIYLSWNKGVDADKTLVRWSTVTFPTNTTDGTQVYFDTGTNALHDSLNYNLTYYYSAWGEDSSIYSTTYATDYAQPSAPGSDTLSPPATTQIVDAKAFQNYLKTGDILIVIAYQLLYVVEPAQEPKDFFVIQLLDGATLKAQTAPTQWGYRPISIYQAPGHTLTWGSSYTIKLIGRADRWDTPPSYTYAMGSSSWAGSDLDELDEWVVDTATRIEDYDDTDYTVYSAVRGRRVLNDDGGEMFEEAIPSLMAERENIFAAGLLEFETPGDPDPAAYAESLEGSFGTQAMERFEALGDDLGMGGDMVGAMIWAGFVMLIMGGVAYMGASPQITIGAVAVCMGVGIGLFAMPIAFALGVLLIMFVVMQLVLKGI